ncbi:unnamed protein product [Pieris brassicae]|uniref:Fibroin heavy chain N-terminal domain-containing protein n=1 Tax=Pieris brassicae TaxID=7116 RepID=A0A9P0TFP0_PIEBR|nr:unnamed protein product [Pieris brassicae]
MRVTTFVILCCALQYVSADAIDDALQYALRNGRLETKKVNETDEVDYDSTGNAYEKSTTTKEYEAYGDVDKDVTGDDVKVKTIVIKTDSTGHETIWEEDVLIHKKNQPGSSAETETRTVLSSKPRGPLNAGPTVIVENNSRQSAASIESSVSTATSGSAPGPIIGFNIPVQYSPYGNQAGASATAAATAGSAGGVNYGLNGFYGGVGGVGQDTIVINNSGASGSSSSAAAASSAASSGNSLAEQEALLEATEAAEAAAIAAASARYAPYDFLEDKALDQQLPPLLPQPPPQVQTAVET